MTAADLHDAEKNFVGPFHRHSPRQLPLIHPANVFCFFPFPLIILYKLQQTLSLIMAIMKNEKAEKRTGCIRYRAFPPGSTSIVTLMQLNVKDNSEISNFCSDKRINFPCQK